MIIIPSTSEVIPHAGADILSVPPSGKCVSLDNAIDAEVYQLYNLTEEEIELITESANK